MCCTGSGKVGTVIMVEVFELLSIGNKEQSENQCLAADS